MKCNSVFYFFIIVLSVFLGIFLSLLSNSFDGDLLNKYNSKENALNEKPIIKKVNKIENEVIPTTYEKSKETEINEKSDPIKISKNSENSSKTKPIDRESKENIKKKIKIKESEKSENLDEYKNKLRVAVSYSSDNDYVWPTLVAATSLCENAGSKTIYDIYMLIGDGFKKEYKKVLKTVETNHKGKCKMIFIDMKDHFKNALTQKRIPTATYYRLELPDLLPEVKRIIWMDGDTGVFEDLSPLMSLDMKGKFILGFLDSLPDAIKNFGIKDATVLCAGVLLIDLESLRKNGYPKKFYDFIEKHNKDLNQQDQTVINVVLQDKIGPLPPKYGIWGFEALKYGLQHNARQRPWNRYNEKEFTNAYFHPAIMHFVWPKPFWKYPKSVFYEEWWNYAKKTGYFSDIYNKSPKKNWRMLRLINENNFGYFYSHNYLTKSYYNIIEK